MSFLAVLQILPGLLSAPAALTADTVREPGVALGSVIVHRQSGLPLVALRLSVLADDPPGLAGVGHLIQHLHEPQLRERVERVGGRVSIERNTDALVYTATGPADELEHLAAALRAVVEPPNATESEFSIARQALARARVAAWETAAGPRRAALTAGRFPAHLPAAGTDASAARWERTRLVDVWAAMYRPERVSLVAVGDVETRAVEAAFAGVPPARQARALPALRDSVAEPAVIRPEATRGWLGQGYDAADAGPAALTVAARLLQSHLQRRLPAARVEAEHWWTHHGQALALIVAAPEADLPLARRTLSAAVSAVPADLDAAAVRDAAAAVRRELLFYARTPAHMAELIGRFADREGDADAAQRYFAALDRVSEREVRRLFDDLLARTPVRVDVPPQQLPRRP